MEQTQERGSALGPSGQSHICERRLRTEEDQVGRASDCSAVLRKSVREDSPRVSCAVTRGRSGPGKWGSGRAAVGSGEGAEGSLPTMLIPAGSLDGRPEQYIP